jgi:tRNA nucleotidyltransferase (CCA-adding enzyme)
MNSKPSQNLALSLEGNGPHHLADQLKADLPPAQVALLKVIAEIAEEESEAIYLVGGPVRDLLLGKSVKDFDLVLVGDAVALANKLSKRLGGEVTSHPRFGTAKWSIAGIKEKVVKRLRKKINANELPHSIDLVTARQESYSRAGELPNVTFAGIEEDTQRRDFTINTLALRLDGEYYGELLDVWDGLEDLRAGVLRVLHEKSFQDDPTRILRILRFATRFDFTIADDSLALLTAGISKLGSISGERIRNELDLVIGEVGRSTTLKRLESLAVLKGIESHLFFDDEMEAALGRLNEKLPGEDWEIGDSSVADVAYVLWLGNLPEDGARAVAEHLSMGNGLSKAIVASSQFRAEMDTLSGMKTSEVVAKLDKLPALTRYALYLDADDAQAEIYLRYAQDWRKLWPKTDGNELVRRGMPEGPIYKEILGRLRAAWLDEEISNQDEEKKLLEQLLNESAS